MVISSKNFISRSVVFLLIVTCISSSSFSKPSNNPANKWSAHWIAMPGNTETEYGIYYFRKSITIDSKPSSFKIHLSADNRYKLYVNGLLVSLGPARGDNYSWNYETISLAPYLKKGKNTVAALVFNEAQFRPVAQISFRTALMVQGNSLTEDVLNNTNKSWKCTVEKAYYRSKHHQNGRCRLYLPF